MTLPRPVKAVVFDMDGLLVDTEAMFRDVLMEASRRRGVELPLPVFLRMVGLQAGASRAVAMAHFGEDFDYQPWIDDAWALAHARCDLGVAVKAGAAELLDFLEAADVPRAVATSSGHATVARQLGPVGLLSRFQTIVAGGDYARGKPAPDPFLLAASRLGVDPADCLALEDSHNGVRAAHAAGMMTIMVPDLLEATPEIARLCVAVMETLHGVRALLEAQTARRGSASASGA
jgi:beta-phosphoglucomutase-like phosphatase (HAD superfamily)